MANNVAPEMSCENTALFWCEVTTNQVNPVTGEIETVPRTGQTVRLFLSATEELSTATKIGTLEILALTEIPDVGRYWGTINGATLSSNLLPTYKDQPVHVHFKIDGGNWHETESTIVRNERSG
jgi:hypothetical protein